MQWQDADAVNAIKFPVISHLQHSLHMNDDSRSSLTSKKIQSYAGSFSRLSKSANLAVGIAVDVPKSTVEDWKSMQKLARNAHENILSDKDYGNICSDANAHTFNAVCDACFEPSIGAAHDLKTAELLNRPMPTPMNDCHALTNWIHQILPLNFLQQLIVKGVLRHVINAKNKPPSIDSSDQMLFYVRGAGGVGKNRVIKAIEMGFSLLQRREELIITAPTGAAASGIGGSTVHAAMGIKIPGKKSAMLNANAWTRRTSLIVDEVSMISLKLLASMDGKIRQAKSHD